MSGFNSACDVVGFALVVGAVAWAFWKVWQQGVRQAKDFDRGERREKNLCPECAYDLRGGRHERCPECGCRLAGGPEPDADDIHWGDGPRLDPQRLASDWPAAAIEPAAPSPGDPLVPVHATRLRSEAALVQQQLLARGVWARLEERQEYRVGVAVSRVAGYVILVPGRDRERAEAILERFRLNVGG